MIDWQVTAKTIYCDAIEDDVIIMVYRDGSTKCTGYQKFVEQKNKGSDAVLNKKSRILKRELKCEGPLDIRITSYRDALAAQDKA